MSAFAALSVGAVAARAQTTWIYDSAGGGHFTDLQVAVDSVAPGDTILVRSFALRATVRQSLRLVGEGSGRVSRLRFLGVGGATITCSAANLRGDTLILDSTRFSAEGLVKRELAVTNGSVATFHGCSFDGSSIVSGGVALGTGSRATFSNCMLAGSRALSIQTLGCRDYPSTAGLHVGPGCAAQLSNCNLQGGSSGTLCSTFDPGSPALVVDANAAADIARCTLTAGVMAVANAGTLRVDGSGGPWPGAQASVLPSTSGNGAAPGGVIQANVESQPGLPAVIVASLGVRSPITWPEGLVWIDPGAYVVLRIGVLDPTGQMNTFVNVPSGVQRGLPLTMQGAVQLPGVPTLTAAMPAVLHVL